MWTYRESVQEPLAQPQAALKQKEPALPVSASETQTKTEKKPEPYPAARTKHKVRFRSAGCFGGIYLCGLTAGSVCTAFLGEQLLQYAEYFAASYLELYRSGSSELLFSTQFLAAFVQLTIVCILGFSVLGKWLLPAFVFAKGVGTGCFWAECIAELGLVKGFFTEALVFWLPEVLGAVIAILLSNKALQVSSALWNCCQDRICPLLKQKARQLFRSYLISCLAALFPCVLCVLLLQSFGAVCGIL